MKLSDADFAPFLEALRLDIDAHALGGAANGSLVRGVRKGLRRKCRSRCAPVP